MGTNFYMQKKPCHECGLTPQEVHLGKRSGGWLFLVQGYRKGSLDWVLPNCEVHSLKELFDLVGKLVNKGWHVEDEYNREMTVDEFREAVEGTKTWQGKPAKSHYRYVQEEHPRYASEGEDIEDDEGWPVSYHEFS